MSWNVVLIESESVVTRVDMFCVLIAYREREECRMCRETVIDQAWATSRQWEGKCGGLPRSFNALREWKAIGFAVTVPAFTRTLLQSTTLSPVTALLRPYYTTDHLIAIPVASFHQHDYPFPDRSPHHILTLQPKIRQDSPQLPRPPPTKCAPEHEDRHQDDAQRGRSQAQSSRPEIQYVT